MEYWDHAIADQSENWEDKYKELDEIIDDDLDNTMHGDEQMLLEEEMDRRMSASNSNCELWENADFDWEEFYSDEIHNTKEYTDELWDGANGQDEDEYRQEEDDAFTPEEIAEQEMMDKARGFHSQLPPSKKSGAFEIYTNDEML